MLNLVTCIMQVIIARRLAKRKYQRYIICRNSVVPNRYDDG
jgi:hypothetical protein